MVRYQIIRQDDNGNRFVLDRKYSSKEKAEAEKDKLEKRGHKQTYWVEPIKKSN